MTISRYALLCGAAALALCALAAGPAAAQDASPAGAQTAAGEPEGEVLDPFAYNAPGGGGEFVPYEEGTIPPGIEVVGIAVPGNGQPVAALYIPGHVSLFYVREGDVLGVNVVKTASSPLTRDARPSIAFSPQQRQMARPPASSAAPAPAPASSTPISSGRSRGAKLRANMARAQAQGLLSASSAAPAPAPAAAPAPARAVYRAPTQGGAPALSEEVLYIEIGEITDQQVELHPVAHPENVRILR